MTIHEQFEQLDIHKSLKIAYMAHDVAIYKYDTHRQLGIKFSGVTSKSSITKRFRGFIIIISELDNSVFIQTEGNIAERQIYSFMCQFILEAIESLDHLDISNIENAIESWINFGKKSNNNLPESLQIGLFGELLFLRSLMGLRNQEMAMIAWQGPERKKVDFILNDNFGIEIKSVSDPLNSNITISSVQQLSAGYDKHYLRVYKLVIAPNGEKITELFNKIYDSLSSNLKDDFIEKCCNYGFNYMIEYENLKPISFASNSDYSVSLETFPKISGPLDPRVIEVKYKISLDGVPELQQYHLVEELNKL